MHLLSRCGIPLLPVHPKGEDFLDTHNIEIYPTEVECERVNRTERWSWHINSSFCEHVAKVSVFVNTVNLSAAQ